MAAKFENLILSSFSDFWKKNFFPIFYFNYSCRSQLIWKGTHYKSSILDFLQFNLLSFSQKIAKILQFNAFSYIHSNSTVKIPILVLQSDSFWIIFIFTKATINNYVLTLLLNLIMFQLKNFIVLSQKMQSLICQKYSQVEKSIDLVWLLFIFKMWRKKQKKRIFRWQNKAQWVFVFGLMLSETNFIIIMVDALQFKKLQYFPVSLCLATTLYLIVTSFIFVFTGSLRQGDMLQTLQKVTLPLTAFLVILSSQQNDASITGICLGCFILQVIILGIKIMYFDVVITNSCRISIVSKLARIGKICLLTLLGMIGLARIYMAIFLMVYHLLAVLLFSVKFTYEKIGHEYVLLLGMVAGIVSSVELLIGAVWGVSYLYLGEIFLVLVYLMPINVMRALIELKYLFVISSMSTESSAMDHYISLLFISECLFEDKKSFDLSPRAINKGLSCFLSMVQDPIMNNKTRFNSQSKKNIIRDLSIKEKDNLRKMYIEIMMDKLKSQENFIIVSFILRSCLEYDENYSKKALILYHRLWQAQKSKTSFLQRIKFQYLSSSIIQAFQNPQNSCETMNFIRFNSTLTELNQQLSECLKHQLKLIDGVSQNNHNFHTKIQSMLLKRYRFKQNIQAKIQICFSNDTYFSSHQFKFMYIIYHIVISKKYLQLKQAITSKFLSPQSINLQYGNKIGNVIVLSGFNCGQIINSNQSFKNEFGIISASLNRLNIAEFIPFQSVKKKHRALMMDQIDNLTAGRNNHADYQCYLCFDEAEFGCKIKRIDKFQISTRVFHQQRQGFNFVCSLTLSYQREKGKMMVSSKDYNQLLNKNAPIIYKNEIKITQIDEQFQLYQIQLSLPSFHDNTSKTMLQSTIKQKCDPNLATSEKLQAIQRKLLSLKGQKLSLSNYNCLQLLIACFVIASLGVSMFTVHSSTSMLVEFISEEQVIIQQAELLRSRLLLEEELLSLIMKTKHFPRDMCVGVGIADLEQYLLDKFHKDLFDQSDQFMALLVTPNRYGDLNKYLYTRHFSSEPFVRSPLHLISFQKQMRLLKAHLSSWYTTIKTKPLDIEYYSNVVAGMLNNLGRESPGSTSALLEGDQIDFSKALQGKINIYRVFSIIGMSCAFILLMVLRIKDYKKILDYLKVALNLQKSFVDQRRSQLRGSIDSLHKSRNYALKQVNFTSGWTIELQSPQTKNIRQVQLRNLSKILRKQDEIYKQNVNKKQKYEKIIFQQQSNRLWILRSTKVEILELFLIFCVLILLINILFVTESSRIASVQMCNDAKEQLQLMQQKFINVIAYNWLKYLSFFQEVDLTFLSTLYSNAIAQLKINQYRQKIMQAYTLQLSNYILHGNFCSMFADQSQCMRYRSGIFEGGLSMLLPFVLKQQFQSEEFTPAGAQMYAFNICDKIWLLFEAVVPFTIEIPTLGFSRMIQATQQNLSEVYISTVLFMILLLMLVGWFVYGRCESERSMREQVLSLDEVKKLYSLPDFRPFLNEIYYQ